MDCRSLDRIVVASTPYTPLHTEEAKRLGVETIITPGKGFHEDMRFAIRTLRLRDVLVISSDLPLVTAATIEQAVEEYRASGKSALAVMAPAELYAGLGVKPDYVLKIGDRDLVPVGINLIDGRRIDEGELDQAEMIVTSDEIALNVNTVHDLEIARKKTIQRGNE